MKTVRVQVILVLSALFAATLGCNLFDDLPEDEPTSAPPVSQPTIAQGMAEGTDAPAALPNAGAVGGTTDELAQATVQILALYPVDSDWGVAWTGSGSLISADGLILTNAHVVDDRYDEYSTLGIALTDRTDQPPELQYLADIDAVDYALDLAVIRIVSDLDGNPLAIQLPYVGVGDSDSVQLGGELRILGYPGIGGDTITFTEGAVSGFTQERGVEGRAWIKTDATIAGGNSGGMAVDSNGFLVGVPTRASAGSPEDDIVDCRPVADTNRDGYIDGNDTCVPIGGFINGLRPVNLAQPLISAALAGQAYAGGVQPGDIPASGYDLSDVYFMNLVFSDGVTENDQPTQLWYALPSGTSSICAFWDYQGMQDGLVWSAYWLVNGTLSEGGSTIDNFWSGGSSGNWWVCISDENGLVDGLYELSLEVEGQLMTADAVYVGGNRSIVDFVVVNNSSETFCIVQLSQSDAQNWGQDELGAEEVVDPGYERTFNLATGTYDLRLLDCNGNSLLEEYELEITESMTYTVSD